MVVLDGANLAYAYDKAWQGGSSLAASQQRPVPDARGIVVACQYFLAAGIRVLAVVPATIAAGTSEIQRLIIAREVLRGYA